MSRGVVKTKGLSTKLSMKKKTQACGKRKRTSPKTGAPPLSFTFDQIDGMKGWRLIVEGSRADREHLKALSTEEIDKQVYLALAELVDRIAQPRTVKGMYENPAESVATMAIAYAHALEDLAHSDLIGERMAVRKAAAIKDTWPVRLRLGNRRRKAGTYETTLESAEKAKAYLLDIHLGQSATHTFKYVGNPDASLFKKAAEQLLARAVVWREDGICRQFADGGLTEWAKCLSALELPVTTENAQGWWDVLKVWADENWISNRSTFNPLISASTSKGESLAGKRHELVQSEVRRNIIDLKLKEAFFGLAKPADL